MPTALSTGTSCSYVFVLIQCIISAEILKLSLLQRRSFQLPGFNNGAGVPLHWKNLIYNLPILNQERTEQSDELTASMFDFSAQPSKGSSGQRNLNLAKNFVVHQWRWFKYWGALWKNRQSFYPGLAIWAVRQLSKKSYYAQTQNIQDVCILTFFQERLY